MDEGLTQAPLLLSESDLIGLMDQKGIGTDATIAEHIQKIQQRKVSHTITGDRGLAPQTDRPRTVQLVLHTRGLAAPKNSGGLQRGARPWFRGIIYPLNCFKCVSCDFDRLNGRYSSLQAA